MKLYEISEMYRRALEELTVADEIPEDVISDTLEGLAGDFRDKAIAVAAYTLELKAEAEAIDAAAQRMLERRGWKLNKMEWLKSYLLREMDWMEIKAIENTEISLSVVKNSPKVLIDDQAKIPMQYIGETVIRNVRKKDILRDISSGKTVPGARLAQTYRLKIG